MNDPVAWLQAFCLTQMVEMGVYVRFSDRPWRERIAIAFAATAITHPVLWWVIVPEIYYAEVPLSANARYWIAVAVGETLVVSVEAIWLWLFGVRAHHAIAWSFGANASSYLLGHFCYEHLGW